MGNPKDSYGKGYAGGIRHAEHERRDGLAGELGDLVTGPIHYNSDGSLAYKEGFKEGRKDSQGKK